MIERQLGKLLGIFHNVTYYAPEMKAFADVGLPEYWRAYMAYRSAPMGLVSPAVVTATFYNFAPAVVAAAIPSAWQTTTPADALALRDSCVAQALQRAFGEGVNSTEVVEAGELVAQGIADCEAGARPLFGAHAELAAPETPIMRLWQGCTLWREHRGDGHNIALAAAGIDGIACHVLLAAKGVGNQDIITKIRGWTDAEWKVSSQQLIDRDLLSEDGAFTDAGQQLRREIETHTDRLAAPPVEALGEERSQRLIELMEPLVATLIETGVVAASWPPKRPPSNSRPT